jgi:hypothetical protein
LNDWFDHDDGDDDDGEISMGQIDEDKIGYMDYST